MRDSILTLPKLAVLLKVAEKMIYTMFQDSQILAIKIRGQNLLRQEDIDRRIDQKKGFENGNVGKAA